ncbi:hypothetical protein Riv7116_6539 [Rivularia sp. PCC 7116]|uniref:hypothetical protein n=1 Tax=Rivularia sp. PCC 7116 TaxID=373994 RepID=UPI00029F2D69|nr:hypothetical protein [Rivularia sp. PCC 7116]AFY58867.1 hypothetical protein Riv7116_6539 [Rivularia sp. PCC 7116]
MPSETRENQYFSLIEQLLKCPNGKEPELIEANSELVDADLIKSMMQVATSFAHNGNEDGAKFLIHVAKELSKQLGFYPEVTNKE